MQIIDSFLDTVMSVCLTKTEIIGGSVDGTVRTFDIRIGRYGTVSHSMVFLLILTSAILAITLNTSLTMFFLVLSVEKYQMTWGNLSTVSQCQMMVTAY